MASITRKTIRPRGLSYLGNGNLVTVKTLESEEYCLSFFAHTAWPIMVSNKPIIEIIGLLIVFIHNPCKYRSF